MKEKLENVIQELANKRDHHDRMEDTEPIDSSIFHGGISVGLTLAINKLKEILTHEREHTTQHHIPTKKET